MSMLKEVIIREVWAYNLENEFNLILQAIYEHHVIISMDTEFPSVIHSPKIDYRHLLPSDHYSYLKANIDDLKLIQVGLTLSDSEGNLPDFGTNNSYIWEFNFCDFDVNHDPCNQDSIDMLRRQGINFERNLFHGVDSKHFADLMFSSILVYNEYVTWVTFSSAYDFGYLVKILTGKNLPNQLEDFLKIVEILFGKSVYDMKYMMKFCNSLYGGLERVATTLNLEILNVCREVGNAHQAALDSLLTWHVFDKMIKTYFKHDEAPKHAGVLFGLEIAA
ncbi:probable CCR4-associated factor 1 homolog 11 [Lathyrus oleraceus]|uniref:probable CCR4-associated factor 1 homolog 11 n=1 Tax=Pisum sativum TaxID=3888 RepID=UPI0021D094F8|nr:probable CCR4-associated factor 1 homolog 11 [Pisum sativum]